MLSPLTNPNPRTNTAPNPVDTFGPEASEVTFSAGELGEDSIDMESSYQLENSGNFSPALQPPSPKSPSLKVPGSAGDKIRAARKWDHYQIWPYRI